MYAKLHSAVGRKFETSSAADPPVLEHSVPATLASDDKSAEFMLQCWQRVLLSFGMKPFEPLQLAAEAAQEGCGGALSADVCGRSHQAAMALLDVTARRRKEWSEEEAEAVRQFFQAVGSR